MTRALHFGAWMAAIVLLLTAAGAQAQGQPQLTGTWRLDPAQSQLPHFGKHHHGADASASSRPLPDVRLQVEQQPGTVKATRTMTRGNKQHALTETLVTDNTDRTYEGRRGPVVTRAVFDADRLLVNETYTLSTRMGERTISRQSVWTVSPDGRTLTIDTTVQSPRGEKTIKAVYVRA